MTITINLTGGAGTNQSYIVTDLSGIIIDINTSNTIDFSGYSDGDYNIYHVFYENISGMTIGQNISNLAGCFALSNAIPVNVVSIDSGSISTSDPTTICL